MKSLFVTRWPPSARNGGAALRNAQNIAALASFGPVDVLSISKLESGGPSADVRHWEHIEAQSPARRFPGEEFLLPGQHPLVDSYRPEAAKRALQHRLKAETYDVLIVEELSLAPHLAAARQSATPCLFDAHNVEARLRTDLNGASARGLRRRTVDALRTRRLRGIEGNAVRTADIVWACSDTDAEALRADYGADARVHVVPNTIDVEAFRHLNDRQRPTFERDLRCRLLFTATFAYQPNAHAALELITEVLPRLRARGIAVDLSLVGRDPTAAMQSAANAALEQDIKVRVTGAVPEILPYYSDSAIFVAPLRAGSGTRLKILEAFAAGLPVVATAKAVEGLAVSDGYDVRLAETPEGFADAIASLQNDPESWQAQACRALETVRQSYSWQAAATAIAVSFQQAGIGPMVPRQ